MTAISVFHMFKIGVGPSSSHTMGPWKAAARFMEGLTPQQRQHTSRLQVDLFGSLAKTGKGHGTDIAVQLGLLGTDPETIAVEEISQQIDAIRQSQSLLCDDHRIPFHPERDVVFHFDRELAFHPNGVRFTATIDDECVSETWFSIGGGFITREHDSESTTDVSLPFPVSTAADLLLHCHNQQAAIADIVLQNELTWRSEHQVYDDVQHIGDVMLACAHRGCCTSGILPGGLNVKRRAASTAEKLLDGPVPTTVSDWISQVRDSEQDFQSVLDWVSCVALAVNEENAAFGRVVTAPTNGSAGVIPAVLFYFVCFEKADPMASRRFLMTAAEIGSIFKKGATISAALGGCQAEIGVSSAMAAAALAEGLGGTPGQAVEAAEIAMEHHLGMTCDPVGGLVQIPCIERNAMGAAKAITAARMALQRDPAEARVSLDAVVQTMWKTALDMNARYKETSEGGLAVQIPVNLSEC